MIRDRALIFCLCRPRKFLRDREHHALLIRSFLPSDDDVDDGLEPPIVTLACQVLMREDRGETAKDGASLPCVAGGLQKRR